MSEKLTDKEFWLNYWSSKTDLIRNVVESEYFSEAFKDVITGNKVENSLEIGGFPGYFSIFLKKYFQVSPTLLDYVIHKGQIKKLLNFNGLSEGDLDYIETDLFSHQGAPNFDLTFSIGFIEHFSDTVDLIQRHVEYLKPGGTLLIIVPNFLGINGWLNKTFDKKVYDKHYIDCMEKNYLKKCAMKCDLEEIETRYFGHFSVWLENYSEKNILFKVLFKLLWVSGKLFTKIFPFETKSLSPYTILTAQKIN